MALDLESVIQRMHWEAHVRHTWWPHLTSMSLLPVHVTSVRANFLPPCGLWPARLLCPQDSPGKNSRVGCRALLQGTFLTQGLSPLLQYLLQWQAGSLPLWPLRKPSIFHTSKKKELLRVRGHQSIRSISMTEETLEHTAVTKSILKIKSH